MPSENTTQVRPSEEALQCMARQSGLPFSGFNNTDKLRTFASLVAKECMHVYQEHLGDYRVNAQLVNAHVAILARFGAKP